jgi:polysaccharide export outer membrane protein
MILVASILSECSILPASGPSSGDVRAAAAADAGIVPYAVVRITPEVERILARHSPKISQVFTDQRGPSEVRFGTGDVVSVTIFESAAGGCSFPRKLEAYARATSLQRMFPLPVAGLTA